MENQFTQEYIKHKFTEDEKREIAIEMAQKVSELQRTEGSIKAIKSDYKSRIDGVQANINHAATKLNNGYEMQSVKCEVVPDWDKKIWKYIKVEDGTKVREKQMTTDDLQMKID